MNYKESLDFLFSQLPMFSRIGAAAYKPGLDTSINLDNRFGNPHRRFKSIHIAGTNGKGSTSHLLASILQSQGYKVGLYTSPHLADFRERMRINGKMIPEQKVIDFVERWQNLDYDGHPSFFELTMMMAFDWFAEESVDYAVIEVGMGGRLDSTNIISPIASVITNISPDHTQFLGDTLPAIAREKAGIIKAATPVVIGNAEGEVREVFISKATEVNAPIVFAQDTPAADFETIEDGTILISSKVYGSIISPLGGEYQKENLNTVLHAVDMLRECGVGISDSSVSEGIERVIENTGLAGRWMITSRSPLTICDTGHNIAGLTYTMHQLKSLYRRRLKEWEASGIGNRPALRMVIGFVNDKDVEHIAPLFPDEGLYYLTQASVPRAMPVENLTEIFVSKGYKPCHCCGNVPGSVEKALKDAAPNDILFIGGSTFVVADYLAGR